MKVIQLSDGYRPGDGVSNVVASVDEILKRNGIETIIIPRQLLKGDVESELFKTDDIAICNMGTILDPEIKKIPCRKILFFHNITTPSLVEDADGETGILLDAGYYQLRRWKDEFEYVITSSEYSKQVLVEAGYEKSRIFVLPISVRFDHLKLTPDEDVMRKNKDNTSIVFMGRVYPNKKHEDVIRAFSVYKKKYNESARLNLVGSMPNKSYVSSLLEYAKELGVAEDVLFTGHVSMREYVAYYRSADLFLCMSEHEGFCIPLVEAMYFGVPVLAYGSTAIPGTLGGAGVLFDKKDYEYVADMMDQIISDDIYRKKILDGQSRRLRELSNKDLEVQYMTVINTIINNPVDTSANNYSSDFKLSDDVFSDVPAVEKSKLVVYGAGAAGAKIFAAIRYQLPESEVFFCDKGKAGSRDSEFDTLILSPEEAIRDHKDYVYIVSLQDKHIRKEVMFMLIKEGVPMENIYVYEKHMNKVL